MKPDQRIRRALLVAAVLAQPWALHAADPANAGSIRTRLQPLVEKQALAGAVTLVADKETVLSLEAVGYANLAAKKPMTTDALFWIASQSKPITAVAFMMLVDEGKIKLDDPVEKYLPEFRGQMVVAEKDADHVLLRRPKHPITVRNILSHTSGLPFASAMETPTLDMLPLRDAVRSYAMTPLQFEPDTRWQYSNAGINTAGRLIEVLAGMPYEAFLQKRLFEPLGMKDTTFWPDEGQVARLAKAYRANDAKTGFEETTIGQLKYPLTDRRRQPMPAGGLFSTAADVGRFCAMVLHGGELNGKRLLSQEAVKQMTTRQTGEGLKENYGLGWSTGGQVGHGGALSTNMNIDTKRGLVTVFLVQQAGPFPNDGGKAGGIFHQAANELFERTRPAPQP